MINVVVCDDEENILKEIADIVENKLVNKQVVCNVVAINDARILLEKLKENPIDVLFLDIDMPYYSGMDIASFINENMLPTMLVFVTSHDELVFKTFAYKPFGFLRKSHIEEEIEELVDRLSKELEFRKQELVITKAGEIVKLTLCDINYIESEGNYLNIRVGEEIIRHRDTMSNMENELKAKDFIRCHKGYLVNVNCIEKMKMSELVVKCGNEEAILPVGRSYEKDVKKKIMESIKRG